VYGAGVCAHAYTVTCA